jgi:hypothetical protein
MTAPRHERVKFFLVWTKDGDTPRRVHATRVAATTEAVRLAEKHPGQKFVVLAAVDKVSFPAPRDRDDRPRSAAPPPGG